MKTRIPKLQDTRLFKISLCGFAKNFVKLCIKINHKEHKEGTNPEASGHKVFENFFAKLCEKTL